MSSWLRRLADRLERARRAARQARDAELPAALKREPQEPPVDPIEELMRIVSEHEPNRVIGFPAPKSRRRRSPR